MSPTGGAPDTAHTRLFADSAQPYAATTAGREGGVLRGGSLPAVPLARLLTEVQEVWSAAPFVGCGFDGVDLSFARL